MTKVTYTKELAHGSFRVFNNSKSYHKDDFDAIISVRIEGKVAYLFGAMGSISIKSMRLIAQELILMGCDTGILQRTKEHNFPFGIKTEGIEFDIYTITCTDLIL